MNVAKQSVCLSLRLMSIAHGWWTDGKLSAAIKRSCWDD